MDPEQDHLLRIQLLENQLSEKEEELLLLRKQLDRNKKRLEKTDKYNEDLLKQVELLSQELHNYRTAHHGTEQETQTHADDWAAVTRDITEDNWIAQSQQANLSVADFVRAAAEEALHTTGFVFDEQSGLYYDQNTGYYYDPANALYYNSLTGVYYTYNEQTQSYSYHSQVDLSQFQTSEVSTETLESLPKKKTKRKQKDETVSSASKRLPKGEKNHGDTSKSSAKLELGLDTNSSKAVKRKSKKTKDPDSEIRLKAEIVKEDSPVIKVTKPSECSVEEVEAIGPPGDDIIPAEMQFEDGHSVEEGECTESSCESSSEEESSAAESANESVEDASELWPPCIRCMVEESTIPSTPVGTLFLVTCSGAYLGREKTNDVCLPDIQISKTHAIIEYNESEKIYTISDVGSRNGTLLNGVRMSKAKEASEPCEIRHNDLLELGGISLRLHIHSGGDTCDQCEPGQVQAAHAASQPKPTVELLTKEEKEMQRRKQLKQIRKKFGLESSAYEEPLKGTSISDTYSDRAQERRKTKGIDTPFAKTEVASMQVAISKKNKGFKMLEKMGWSEGKSLGKTQEGIVEPISVEMRSGHAGLGCTAAGYAGSLASTKKANQKHKVWSKTQERFEQLPDLPYTMTEQDSS